MVSRVRESNSSAPSWKGGSAVGKDQGFLRSIQKRVSDLGHDQTFQSQTPRFGKTNFAALARNTLAGWRETGIFSGLGTAWKTAP